MNYIIYSGGKGWNKKISLYLLLEGRNGFTLPDGRFLQPSETSVTVLIAHILRASEDE